MARDGRVRSSLEDIGYDTPGFGDDAYESMRDSLANPTVYRDPDENSPAGYYDPSEGDPLNEIDDWVRASSPFTQFVGPAILATRYRTTCNGCDCVACITTYSLPWQVISEICNNYRNPECPPPQPPPPPPGPSGPIPPRSFMYEGWANCRYFVYLTRLGSTDIFLDIENPVVERWARVPVRSTDLIIPAYGPIVGLDFVEKPDGTHDMYLVCKGTGVLIRNFSSQIGESGSLFIYNLEMRNWLTSIYNEESRVVTGTQGLPIHRAIWTRGVGLFPRLDVAGGFFTSTDVQRVLIKQSTANDWYIADIREASSIPPYAYPSGNIAVYGTPCPDPPPPPPPPPPPRCPCMSCGNDGCSCDEIARLIDRKLRPIYKILGFPQGQENPKIRFDPEETLKAMGRSVYNGSETQEIDVYNLKELVGALSSSLFSRAGYHRLPAKLPQRLTGDRSRNDLIDIPDAMSWQEWLIKQLDAILGQFPVKIKVKDEEGRTTELELKNLAEAIAELSGLNLNIASDADFAANLALKAVVEAAKASTAAIIAQDYAKANAQYLGYKGNTVMREVKTSITPGKTKKNEILASSTQKIPGWRWEGDDSLQATLNQLLIGVGILKAALVQPWEPGQPVTGDAIRQDLNQDGIDDDEEWQQFLNERRNPPSRRRVEGTPDIGITDLSDSDTGS